MVKYLRDMKFKEECHTRMAFFFKFVCSLDTTTSKDPALIYVKYTMNLYVAI